MRRDVRTSRSFVSPGRNLALGLVLALVPVGCAGLEQLPLGELARAAGLGAVGLDDRTIVAGLREALRVGTDRTVQATGRIDGFLANPSIRIPLPEPLEQTAAGLRQVGLAGPVDELERAMNRAAERAASEATPVFVQAITRITFADARGLLYGGERAATDYFERTTRDELRLRFEPVVRSGMDQVGLVRLYDGLIGELARYPWIPRPRLDLDAYVTQGALDGLFFVLAQEEARIRADPAARTTELLRRVFGGAR